MGLWIMPGIGELTLDLYYDQSTYPYTRIWFGANQSPTWPRQSLRRVISDCRQRLPFINRGWPSR